jgi:hypothetical protein
MGDVRDEVDQPKPAEPTKKADFVDHPRDAEHIVSNYDKNFLPEGVERDPAPVAGKSVLDSTRERQAADRAAAETVEKALAEQKVKDAEREAAARADADKTEVEKTLKPSRKRAEE